MHRMFTIAALVLSLGVSSAEAAKRVALVIGNDSYKTLPDLDAARRDADGIASKLRSLGWDVVLKKDLSRRQAYRQIATFESKLRDAEVGLVYYAGHGIQKDGKNYLIPSDAEIEVDEDLEAEAFTLSKFLQAMDRAGAPINIVILDSCRDNPLPRRSRSAERGLAAPSLPAGIKGTAIVFSAGPGQAALDGPKNGHGVFTGELLKVLDRPGLKLEEVFKETARQVAVRTNSKQKPWMNSSVTSDFYFQRGKAVPAASVPASGGLTPEMLFWQSIANSDRAGDYQAYLSQYPSGAFAALARSRLSGLKEQAAAPAPAPVTAATAQTASVDAGVLPDGKPEEQYNHAYGLMMKRKMSEAENALKAFLERYPKHELADNASYWLGEMHYAREDFQEAINVYYDAYKTYQKGNKVPAILLKLGMSLASTGEKEAACSAYDELMSSHPKASRRILGNASRMSKQLGC